MEQGQISAEMLGDMRAEMARHRIKQYELARAIGVHRVFMNYMLNGRRPMSTEMGHRIAVELEKLKAQA